MLIIILFFYLGFHVKSMFLNKDSFVYWISTYHYVSTLSYYFRVIFPIVWCSCPHNLAVSSLFPCLLPCLPSCLSFPTLIYPPLSYLCPVSTFPPHLVNFHFNTAAHLLLPLPSLYVSFFLVFHPHFTLVLLLVSFYYLVFHVFFSFLCIFWIFSHIFFFYLRMSFMLYICRNFVDIFINQYFGFYFVFFLKSFFYLFFIFHNISFNISVFEKSSIMFEGKCQIYDLWYFVNFAGKRKSVCVFLSCIHWTRRYIDI